MIIVTRLDHKRFALNPDLIERLQESPDTTVHMVDGQVYVIEESLERAIELIVAYRARVLAAASGLASREV